MEAALSLAEIDQAQGFNLTVYGAAAPAGSKRAVVNPSSGRAFVIDANKNVAAWKREVRQAAGEAFHGELYTGPVSVEFTFYRVRPKGHYGTGRNDGVLKASAPAYPTQAPDALKLARGVEDALTGLVYRDDAQIVDEVIRKRYGSPARVELTVLPL